MRFLRANETYTVRMCDVINVIITKEHYYYFYSFTVEVVIRNVELKHHHSSSGADLHSKNETLTLVIKMDKSPACFFALTAFLV